MSSEILFDPVLLERALALAGRDERVREAVFDALREAEAASDDPARFQSEVRWPIIQALLADAGVHRIVLTNGLVFEVGPDSRIDRAFLLSASPRPDHVWEPQTTKLLLALTQYASHVIVGGAYIGDQVLPMAHAMAALDPHGTVHAFEPMALPFRRLLRNLEINDITNVMAQQQALWDRSDEPLSVRGHVGVASAVPVEPGDSETTRSITIDDYAHAHGLDTIDVILLDTEGGEERALVGARELLQRPFPAAPNVVFEIHQDYVDTSNGLEQSAVVRRLTEHGYRVYAVRDFHGNRDMAGRPVEIVPVDSTYLEGPPHGFNILASKDPDIVERLGLEVVPGVSPKLLPHRERSLHHPRGGW